MNGFIMVVLKKLLAVLLAVLTPPLTLLFGFEPTAKFDPACIEVMEKTDGFMKGICHDNGEMEMLHNANIEWKRDDIPFPFAADGSLSPSYVSWKAEMQEYVNNGIKIFGITPYPDDYIEYGLDPRDEASREGIQDIARFFMEDLDGIVSAFQVTNEMGIDRFTLPLTLDEAAEFIGMQLEAMYPIRGDVIIGYNLGGLAILQLPMKMAPWHKYCDYVGVDMYLGSFEDIANRLDQYIAIIGFVRKVTNKPIILCEFGYIGYGEPKSEEEKIAVLQQYGYNSEAEATADMDNFLTKLPPEMSEEIIELYPDYSDEELADIIFNGEYSNHFYCTLPDGYGLKGYEHSPDGQAKFYEDLIPRLEMLDYLMGAFIYCWDDSDACYVCGQGNCPVETGWGIVDVYGNPKPAYYAVQEAFGNIDR